MIKFELVLPCYNESKSLQYLIERAQKAALENGFQQGEFQLVMVENGSKDNSKDIFSELLKSKWAEWFRVVYVDINQGYGYGLWQGLKSTAAPVVGWSHADQQCDPIDAFKAYHLLKQNESSAKQVFIKGLRHGRNWKDIIVSRVFEFLAWLILGVKIYEMNAQPKVFHRPLLDAMKNPPKTFAFDLYAIYHAQKNNFKLDTVSVIFPPRVHGLSNWSSHFFSRYKTILGIIRYMISLCKSEGRV
ncbi:MAG: glycosyltransferase family 2 protein [Bdellovibrionota bacterium]